MSIELEYQVQVSSGAAHESWRTKVETREKWSNWAGIWCIYCVLRGRDRVNDCSMWGSKWTRQLYFFLPMAVIEVPFTWHVLPFELCLSRTHSFSSVLMHAYIQPSSPSVTEPSACYIRLTFTGTSLTRQQAREAGLYPHSLTHERGMRWHSGGRLAVLWWKEMCSPAPLMRSNSSPCVTVWMKGLILITAASHYSPVSLRTNTATVSPSFSP